MNAPPMPDALRFSHEAMNTTFELRMCLDDPQLAASLARECLETLDRLEDHLSRFIEDSEVTRINRLRQGETLVLTEETDACLRKALEIHQQSGGLFDITLGRQIEHQKSEAGGPPPAVEGGLMIHPDRAAITCLEPGREIDLGGVGKGFALDQLRALLVDHGVQAGLLAAGASTQLAFGEHPWPVELCSASSRHRFGIRNQALSASGTSIQGAHIVNPGTHKAPGHERLWLVAVDAATADAWSTAAILTPPELLRETLAQVPGLVEIFVERDGQPVALGGEGR